MAGGDELRDYGLFGNNPLYDIENYMMKMEDSLNSADFVYNMMSHKGAVALPGDARSDVTVRKMFKDLGFKPDEAVERLAKMRGITDEKQIARLGDSAMEAGTAGDLYRYKEAFEGPKSSMWFAKVMDSFMASFKANVTAPFPGFHLRNLVSGQFRNLVAGNFSFQSMKQSIDILHGKEIANANRIPAVVQRWEKIRAASGHQGFQG
jgi:hypothetical protein